jgi:hypothetical protein
METPQIDFLIIGATKSATTWLQRSLQANPQVCMPNPEIHYFSREYQRGDDWYFRQFPFRRDCFCVGEKSNSYLAHQNAANRIRKTLPEVKLIAQLRNPVERAYSDYCMLYRRGEVGSDIETHLDPTRAKDNRFLSLGMYYQQLKRYYEIFSEDRILVLLYEQLHESPAAELARVCKFLGIEATAAMPVTGKIKDKAQPVISLGARRILRPVKPLVAPFRELPLFKAIHRTIAREITYPPLSAMLREQLTRFYEPEVGELGRLLRQDLSGWLVGRWRLARAEGLSLQGQGEHSGR